AGLKVLEGMKAGTIKKDDLVAELAKEDGSGITQLAREAVKQEPKQNGQPVVGQPGQPKEPPPPPSPEEILQQQRNRAAVEEQRMSQAVEDARREARRQLEVDPDNAKEILKRAHNLVRENPDLTDRTRDLLTSRLEQALRDVEVRGARIKRDREEQLKLV